MANLDNEKELKEKTSNHIDELAQKDVDQLVRRDELGSDLSFEKGREQFSSLLDLVETLKSVNLESVPVNSIDSLNRKLEEILNTIESIEEFDPSRNRPMRARDNLVEQLDQRLASLSNTAAPILSQSLHKEEGVKELEKELNSKMQIVEEKQEKLNDILDSARDEISEHGVEIHADKFDNEAQTNKEDSKKWMKVAAGFAVLTVGAALGYSFFYKIPDSATTAQLVKFAAGKIVVLSVLYYGMVWSSRNYFAAKHNYVVNKHRQNALDTFQTFVNSADDSDTKDVVLEKTAETIFGTRDSGYKKNQDQQGNNSNLAGLVNGLGKANGN